MQHSIWITQKPTEKTNAKASMLMDYVHTHPHAKIHYHASYMPSYINSDITYLVLPKARSYGTGQIYLSENRKK